MIEILVNREKCSQAYVVCGQLVDAGVPFAVSYLGSFIHFAIDDEYAEKLQYRLPSSAEVRVKA